MFLCLSLVVLLSLSVVSAGKITPVSAVAKTYYSTQDGSRVIDGDNITGWNGGSFSTYVDLTLVESSTISNIRALSCMSGTGSINKIYMGADSNSLGLVSTSNEYANNYEWFEESFSSPIENVKVIRFETTGTGTWVCWREIEVYREEADSSSTCTDKDGGKNYSTWSSAIMKSPSGASALNDYCISSGEHVGWLSEAICEGVVAKSFEYDCATEGKVCTNGVCVTPTVNVTCTDSDGGKNYGVKGSATGSWSSSGTVTSTDGCLSVLVDLAEEYSAYQTFVNSMVNAGVVTANQLSNRNILLEGYCPSPIPASPNSFTYTFAYDCSTEGKVCLDGACVTPTTNESNETEQEQSCQSLINKVKNPVSYFDNGLGYELTWNRTYSGSWWIDNGAKNVNEYYADWRVRDGDTSYNLDYNVLVFEDKNVDAIKILEEEVNWNICQVDNYWTEGDNRERVYVCNWDALNPTADISNYENNHRDVMWAKDNVLARVYVNWGNYISDEEVARLQQKRLNEILNSLIDNQWNYVGWEDFNIEWPVQSQIEDSLSVCDSDVPEETCSPCWSCKTEPVICPPHGEQKKICEDSCCGDKTGEKKRESTQSCSPGVCSGCYVPKWFDSNLGDNRCIPYGFRFENQVGWNYGEQTHNDREMVSVRDLENEEEVSLSISSGGVATLYVEDWGNKSYTFSKGETVEIDVSEWNENIISLSLYINDLVYDSSNYEDSYIDINFKTVRLGREINAIPSYCDIDGNIKIQKSPEYDGSWAKCQNNYECESNICSSGECIELANAIKEAGRIKKFFFGILCKIANPISTDEYNDCMVNLLGEEVPVEGSSSGGGGGGRALYPTQVSAYSLIDVEEYDECKMIDENTADIPPGFSNFGEVCTEGLKLQYQTEDDKGIFINLVDIDNGKDIYSEILETMRSEDLGGNVFRLEPAELFWFTENTFDFILTQEFTIDYGVSQTNYNYIFAEGNDAVTKWFMDKYPPTSALWVSSSDSSSNSDSTSSTDCTPSYSCTLSPVECPVTGKQTRICTAVTECGEDYTEEKSCVYEG